MPLPGYDAPVHSPPRGHSVGQSDEDSQVTTLERSKQQLMMQIRVKKKELLLKQEIAALNAQLSGIDPSTPVLSAAADYAPTTTELDAANITGIDVPMHLPLPGDSRATSSYVATQADRSRSMSPVYSDHSVEEYDPLHPTISTSRSVTPAQRGYPESVHSVHSVSSLSRTRSNRTPP